MTVITLDPKEKDSHLPPMQVETDPSKWPSANGTDADIKDFHGVGRLREVGYNVSPIPHGTVYEIR